MGESKRRKQLDNGFGVISKTKIKIEISHQFINPDEANVLSLAQVIQDGIKECEFPVKLISFAVVGFAQEKKGTMCMLFSNGEIPVSKAIFMGKSPFQRKLAIKLNRHHEQIIKAWVDESKKHSFFAEGKDGFYSTNFLGNSLTIYA